jgi:DNA-binding Lrp family transcriptional regulator
VDGAPAPSGPPSASTEATTGDPPARGLDEADVALVDAIHVNPRTSFDQLGEALGISPITAARRWRRLVHTGQAWVSSVPGPKTRLAGALFEAECVPEQALQTATYLAAIPQVFSVHMISGPRQLYAMLISDCPASLSQLVLDRLSAAPGLRAVRTSLSPTVFSRHGWRLGAISAEQAALVQPAEPSRFDANRGTTLDEFGRELFLALQHDGRLTYRELGAVLGRSEQVVRRRLTALVQGGQLGFRADFVRSRGGWPTQVALWLQLPPELVATVGYELARWPEVRMSAELVGEANLFVTVQLHDLQQLDGVTRRLRSTWRAVQLVEQRVILRPVKIWGRLLDEHGCAIGTVPVNPWAGSGQAGA